MKPLIFRALLLTIAGCAYKEVAITPKCEMLCIAMKDCALLPSAFGDGSHSCKQHCARSVDLFDASVSTFNEMVAKTEAPTEGSWETSQHDCNALAAALRSVVSAPALGTWTAEFSLTVLDAGTPVDTLALCPPGVVDSVQWVAIPKYGAATPSGGRGACTEAVTIPATISELAPGPVAPALRMWLFDLSAPPDAGALDAGAPDADLPGEDTGGGDAGDAGPADTGLPTEVANTAVVPRTLSCFELRGQETVGAQEAWMQQLVKAGLSDDDIIRFLARDRSQPLPWIFDAGASVLPCH